MEESNFLQNYVGNEITFTLPTGDNVTLTERNGDAESLIGKPVGPKDTVDPLSKYLSKLTVAPKLTPEQIMAMPSANKYYMLMKDRINSLGPIVKFEHTCSNPACEHKAMFEEDLAEFDQDLSLPVSELDLVDPKKIKPYPINKGGEVTHTLKDGRVIRFNCLTGVGELRSLRISKEDQSNTLDLILRNFELQTPTGFMVITNFAIFSARQMAEIRGAIKRAEVEFTMASEVICPECDNKEYVPLILQNDFFFPAEI
jgi:hypothetical protein